MRTFHITSARFTGHVELLYNAEETLVKIDFSNAQLKLKQMQVFLQKLPLAICTIEQFVTELPVTIVEADYCVTFDMFWQAYDKKINKKRCEPLFNKLNKARQIAALNGIKQYDRFLKAEGWRKKADPENYLRNEMWENDWK